MSNVPANDTWTSVVNVYGDVIFVDIQNAVSLGNTYCFNIDLDSPGPKKIVFRVRPQVIDTESDTDSDATEIETDNEVGGNGDGGDIKVEDAEIGISEVKVEDDQDLAVIGPDFEPVVASPCTLLTRRLGNPHPDPKNPTAPWSYYVKKRTEALEDNQESL
ncbi:hypothetical protein DEU56DRAFT_918932 [Suillus clintonianus]|uniref:uncharacterized protein n=1 Tax=Suillus clintonianus TaxID=1904413 RepID=UPI001B876AF5|nr:uncharacterized protein DEU56DRAFT_918932 [Suillus clintonianus]KAG2118325.1 hypothetical protein DEU56DRAFT_918932 [Suillus clintonianus]